jgi:hypothetical protein
VFGTEPVFLNIFCSGTFIFIEILIVLNINIYIYIHILQHKDCCHCAY